MADPNRDRRLMPLLAATAAALMVLDVAGFGPIRSARSAALTATGPIGAALFTVMAPVTDTWSGAVHTDRLQAENRDLRRRVAELEGRLASRPDVEAELAALQDAVGIGGTGRAEQVVARVVADRRDGLERVIEIDRGSDDGVGRSMPVMTGAGLIGRVEVVAADRSVVRLITDREMAVGVRSEFGLGLVVGDGTGGLTLQPTAELARAIGSGAEGVRFVTSGVDRSVYPPGLPVGRLQHDGGPVFGIEAWAPLGPVASGGGTATARARGALDDDRRSGAVVSGPSGGEAGYRIEPLGEIDDPAYVAVILTDTADRDTADRDTGDTEPATPDDGSQLDEVAG